MTTNQDLSVAEALATILASVSRLGAEEIPLTEALGRVLAQTIVARESLPSFTNSAMDGYAVQAADTQTASPEQPITLTVIGDIPAGHFPTFTLSAGTAARITTGAPLPLGADAVIPVEATNEPWRDGSRPRPQQVQLYQAAAAGDYLRHAGEDIRVGTELIPVGQQLRPQEIGVLASLGVSKVKVVMRPQVGILATGDELLPVDAPLSPGKIRNSNSYTQQAQLLELGAVPVMLGVAQDNEADVRHKLQAGLAAGVHLFVSSAGVSVGAYDVVKAVLAQAGTMGFWRVRVRPGKPLAFGHYEGVPYLGLPGNPVSAMVSFELFVRPAILRMEGREGAMRPRLTVILQDPIHSDGRESYIRAHVQRDGDRYLATTTGNQGSHIMRSLLGANALLIVPEDVRFVPAGSPLTALMLDWPTQA